MTQFSRREFLKIGGSVTTGTLLGFGAGDSRTVSQADKPQWLIDLIRLNDNQFENLSAYLQTNRVSDTSSKHFGGFLNNYGLPNA